MKPICVSLIGAVTFCASAVQGSSPSLTGGKASGAPGATITLPISFTVGSSAVAALQCSLTLPSGWSVASASVGTAAKAAAKSVGINKSKALLIIYGINQNNISSGVVVDVGVTVPKTAKYGVYSVPIGGVVLSAANGATVAPGASVSGSITLAAPKAAIAGSETPGPVLHISVPSLVFTALEGGPNPDVQTLLISKTGSSLPEWSASNTQEWLTLKPSQGEEAPLLGAVSVNSQGLGAGTYRDVITVAAPDSEPVKVDVELAVSPAVQGRPSLRVQSREISFSTIEGSDPAAQGVLIDNTGSGLLRWTATHSQLWLNLTPTHGINGSTAGPTMMMWVNAQGLTPGNYSDVVTIRAQDAGESAASIKVNLTVRATR